MARPVVLKLADPPLFTGPVHGKGGAPAWVQELMFDESAARVLVDKDGRLLWGSRLGKEAVERSSCLRLDDGRLVGIGRGSQSRLTAMLVEACASPSHVDELLGADDERLPVFLRAKRATDHESGGVVVLIRELHRKEIGLPDLTRLFGLTPAEHQVVVLLLNGLSVSAIAESQKNSVLTVRTHLKHAYSKIDVRTKEQLFAKLLRLLTD